LVRLKAALIVAHLAAKKINCIVWFGELHMWLSHSILLHHNKGTVKVASDVHWPTGILSHYASLWKTSSDPPDCS
jgi:hypothetical protein